MRNEDMTEAASLRIALFEKRYSKQVTIATYDYKSKQFNETMK